MRLGISMSTRLLRRASLPQTQGTGSNVDSRSNTGIRISETSDLGDTETPRTVPKRRRQAMTSRLKQYSWYNFSSR